MLDAGHYDVVFVESSEHAYSQIKRVQPNLVILCVRIDDADGFQVLSMLKLDEETREIPVLTYTTEYDGQEAEEEVAETAGHGDVHAPKPAVLDELRRCYSRAAWRPDATSATRERIEILGELHGEVMVFQPMAIKEISRGGAQVETGFPLQLDSLHDFRLTLGDRSVVVKGRVAHCSISDVDQEIVLYRSGIEFVEPSERVAGVIASFIDASRRPPGSDAAVRRPAERPHVSAAATDGPLTCTLAGARGSRPTRCAAPARAARCRSRPTPAPTCAVLEA